MVKHVSDADKLKRQRDYDAKHQVRKPSTTRQNVTDTAHRATANAFHTQSCVFLQKHHKTRVLPFFASPHLCMIVLIRLIVRALPRICEAQSHNNTHHTPPRRPQDAPKIDVSFSV